jgi:hypothetical protein
MSSLTPQYESPEITEEPFADGCSETGDLAVFGAIVWVTSSHT